jgi:CheY-like chemotaxis protein
LRESAQNGSTEKGMGTFDNRRILVIDDELSMHEDFRCVLASSQNARADAQFAELETRLFGDTARLAKATFTVSLAQQGQEGVDQARRAVENRQPFAAAFVDMRMPPGWDGLRTAGELWKVDRRLHVVICTAYSDYSWPEALARLDGQDRLLVIKKPFDPVEVWQAATLLCAKWGLAREAEATIGSLERAVRQYAAARGG